MIRIKIDGRMIFKGTVGEWISRPPDEFKAAIQPDATPQPWMKAIAIALSDAVMNDISMNITVLTRLKGVKHGWSMEVVTP